jgi:ring-1,2-phenylacetyl-CoA epoxidase subunit PaaE
MSLNHDQLAKPLKVIRRIQETPDCVSLVLEIPQALKSQYRYQAGQFVTFFLDIDGERLNRSYSLSSSPLVDEEFKITVKMVTGGKGSTFLCERVKEGDCLLTTPPAGHFFKPTLAAHGIHYFLFAAGSGITPVYSILKTVLSASAGNKVTLIYCNRDERSVIYASELPAWQKRFEPRLKIEYIYSRPEEFWQGHKGRLDKSVIAQILLKAGTPGPELREYYLCGPKEFMSTARAGLIDAGADDQAIREEDFAVGLQPKREVHIQDNWTFIGDEQPAESPEKIIALLNGETFEVPAKEGQTVLESLLESGAQPPYSCMDGACMACMAKVIEGRVYQEDPGILNKDNVANRETLTCQAKPLSRIVKVDFDNL